MVQWKKINATIYFFVLSAFPNCNHFFTLPHSSTYVFCLFSSLYFRSAELAHSLLSLVNLDSQVSIKSAANKFPVIYCHCENNLLLFNILFLSNPNPEVLHSTSHKLTSFQKLRKYIYGNWRPFMYTCSAWRSGARMEVCSLLYL